jgi:hypothetical protein
MFRDMKLGKNPRFVRGKPGIGETFDGAKESSRSWRSSSRAFCAVDESGNDARGKRGCSCLELAEGSVRFFGQLLNCLEELW